MRWETINILILSAGRRVELIQKFKQARNKQNINGKIFTADMSDKAPAIYHSDKFINLVSVDSENYLDNLINIIKEFKIDIVIPTIDTELPFLAENKDFIESNNCKVLISDENVIEICNDKFNTHVFFVKNNINTPAIIDNEKIKEEKYNFPLFIKPKSGSSSKNTFKINNEKELRFFLEYVPEPMILRYIEGEEFTIDCFVDFNHKPISIVPRKRIATRGGEISKGKIILDPEIIKETKKIISELKPIGPITVQCIKNENELKFFEINPRFGGGAPISITAGANSPEYIYKLMQGKEVNEEQDIIDGLIALRYDQAVFIHDSEVLEL